MRSVRGLIRSPKLVKKLIDARVRERDVGLSEVTDWTRRALSDAAFEALADRFQRWDDVTPKAARRFWLDRRKSKWRTASYGAGTFVVEPPKTPTRPARNLPAGIRLPPPLSREAWWAKATTRERASWVMAFFAEGSDLFDVDEKPKYTLCARCNGTGRQGLRLRNGDTV